MPKMKIIGVSNPDAERVTCCYIRVSSRDEGRQTLSPEAQRQCIQEYCRLHNLGNTVMFSERESAATIRKRPELMKILEMCRAGQVAYVVVQDLTRLFRDLREALNTFDEMETKYGVKFLSATDMMANEPGADGEFVRGLHLLLGQRERKVLGERTSRALRANKQVPEKLRDYSPAMAYKARNGVLLTGQAPFGYRWGGGRKGRRKLAPCPHNHPILERMVALRGGGLSYKAIALRLLEERVRNKRGRVMEEKFIGRVLRRGWV